MAASVPTACCHPTCPVCLVSFSHDPALLRGFHLLASSRGEIPAALLPLCIPTKQSWNRHRGATSCHLIPLTGLHASLSPRATSQQQVQCSHADTHRQLPGPTLRNDSNLTKTSTYQKKPKKHIVLPKDSLLYQHVLVPLQTNEMGFPPLKANPEPITMTAPCHSLCCVPQPPADRLYHSSSTLPRAPFSEEQGNPFSSRHCPTQQGLAPACRSCKPAPRDRGEFPDNPKPRQEVQHLWDRDRDAAKPQIANLFIHSSRPSQEG